MTPEEIVRKLVEMDEPTWEDTYGIFWCRMCNGSDECGNHVYHKPDCIWVQAKKWDDENSDKKGNNMEEAATKLAEMSRNESSNTERLDESRPFDETDHYKVCYRFLANLVTRWDKELELDHYPTEEESIEIAKMASPYFVRLLKDEEEMKLFKHLYGFFYGCWFE